MELADLLLVAMRAAHSLAAIAWVGGTLFYLLVVAPALARPKSEGESSAARSAISSAYGELVELAVVVFVLSGAILTFDRLSRGAGPVYAALLAVKVLLAFVTFHLGFGLRRRGLDSDPRAARGVVVIGIVVVLIAAVLKVLFEAGLRG